MEVLINTQEMNGHICSLFSLGGNTGSTAAAASSSESQDELQSFFELSCYVIS